MSLQTFEFLKKCGISQITFFRKDKETNIHSESFLKFDFAHFGINRKNRPILEKKNFFLKFLLKYFFHKKKIFPRTLCAFEIKKKEEKKKKLNTHFASRTLSRLC